MAGAGDDPQRCAWAVLAWPEDDGVFRCHDEGGHEGMHRGIDDSFPTVIHFASEDRRAFEGEFPGLCPAEPHDPHIVSLYGRCVLPSGHVGKHEY